LSTPEKLRVSHKVFLAIAAEGLVYGTLSAEYAFAFLATPQSFLSAPFDRLRPPIAQHRYSSALPERAG